MTLIAVSRLEISSRTFALDSPPPRAEIRCRLTLPRGNARVCAQPVNEPHAVTQGQDPTISCDLMLCSTSPATTPKPIESCAPLGLPGRAWRARQAGESHRGLLHARNGSGTRRVRLGSSLWGHAWRGGCRQPSGSEGIVAQGSTRLGHAPQSLIASCDTAGCLPVTAGCHEDGNSGSRVLLPVDTR